MKNPKKATEEEDREVDGDDSSEEEEDWKPELPKRPPVIYK